MIAFFRNRKRKVPALVPNKFEIGLIKRQQQLADAFQKGSKKLSRKSLYFFLGCFCLCFGTAFIRIAITAIQNNHPVAFADPGGVIPQGVGPQGKDYINIQQQWKCIHNLEEYIENMRKRDSIHPGK